MLRVLLAAQNTAQASLRVLSGDAGDQDRRIAEGVRAVVTDDDEVMIDEKHH